MAFSYYPTTQAWRYENNQYRPDQQNYVATLPIAHTRRHGLSMYIKIYLKIAIFESLVFCEQVRMVRKRKPNKDGAKTWERRRKGKPMPFT